MAPLIKAIEGARSSIEIVIFRFDRLEIEKALAEAVKRGVSVHALVAHASRAGEDGLRALEQRLLAAGVTVSRSAGDLVRYHAKFMIIDRREVYLLAFNFTALDIEHSRSFGIVSANRTLLQEAVRLFEADTQRRPYTPGSSALVVSPVSSRTLLASFIRGARSELWIYDPNVSDPAMIRLLEDRAGAGVDVRIIGKLKAAGSMLKTVNPSRFRLHARAMVRDGRSAFIGSQSLRAAELDARREAGAIFRDRQAVSRLAKTFLTDWSVAQQVPQAPPPAERVAKKVAKKVVKAVTKELPPVAPVVEQIIREVGGADAKVTLPPEMEANLKDALRTAIKEVVKDAVEGVPSKSDAA